MRSQLKKLRIVKTAVIPIVVITKIKTQWQKYCANERVIQIVYIQLSTRNRSAAYKETIKDK